MMCLALSMLSIIAGAAFYATVRHWWLDVGVPRGGGPIVRALEGSLPSFVHTFGFALILAFPYARFKESIFLIAGWTALCAAFEGIQGYAPVALNWGWIMPRILVSYILS